MTEPSLPSNEGARLEALRACHILDTPSEPAFDDIVRVASGLCGTPVALVSLVDEDRQWFKARVGVTPIQSSRKLSFCGHAILQKEPLVVPDTQNDPRFADNPSVVNDPRFRFYAGVPLMLDDDIAVGTLCVLDYAPRDLAPAQLAGLCALARQVSRELRLRRDLDRARAASAVTLGHLEAGVVVADRFRIVKLLGQGGVGTVYEAKDDAQHGSPVALKVLLQSFVRDNEVLERFAREARVLARLESPHVARLVDVGNLMPERGALPFLVLELLHGKDLGRALSERGALPWREAVGYIVDACDGVAEAHDLGVIHRDLKPSNVFLAETGDGPPVIKVLDFGIAKSDAIEEPSSTLTREGALVGSPGYMPPEQILASRDVDARSDVWSMGAMLYELLTQRLPFDGESHMEIFAAIMTRSPRAMTTTATTSPIPERLEAIVHRCLLRPREERYASMRDLADALRLLLQSREV